MHARFPEIKPGILWESGWGLFQFFNWFFSRESVQESGRDLWWDMWLDLQTYLRPRSDQPCPVGIFQTANWGVAGLEIFPRLFSGISRKTFAKTFWKKYRKSFWEYYRELSADCREKTFRKKSPKEKEKEKERIRRKTIFVSPEFDQTVPTGFSVGEVSFINGSTVLKSPAGFSSTETPIFAS